MGIEPTTRYSLHARSFASKLRRHLYAFLACWRTTEPTSTIPLGLLFEIYLNLLWMGSDESLYLANWKSWVRFPMERLALTSIIYLKVLLELRFAIPLKISTAFSSDFFFKLLWNFHFKFILRFLRQLLWKLFREFFFRKIDNSSDYSFGKSFSNSSGNYIGNYYDSSILELER